MASKKTERPALILMILTLLLVSLGTAALLFVPDLHARSLRLESDYDAEQDLLSNVKRTGKDGNPWLRFPLPEGIRASAIRTEQTEDGKDFTVRIPGLLSDYFRENPPEGNPETMERLTFQSDEKTGILRFSMTRYYGLRLSEKGRKVTISFLPLSEIYDHVVLVDAPRGGAETGTVIGSGTPEEIREKDLNLSYVKELKTLLDAREKAGDLDGDGKTDLRVFYTRLSDETVSADDRLALAKETGAERILSIRMNSTGSGRESSIHGAEAWYRVEDATGASRGFAETCLNQLLAELPGDSRGVVARDEEPLVGQSEAPVAVLMPGYLTNPEDRTKLLSEDYRKAVCQAFYDGLMESLGMTQ